MVKACNLSFRFDGVFLLMCLLLLGVSNRRFFV